MAELDSPRAAVATTHSVERQTKNGMMSTLDVDTGLSKASLMTMAALVRAWAIELTYTCASQAVNTSLLTNYSVLLNSRRDGVGIHAPLFDYL